MKALINETRINLKKQLSDLEAQIEQTETNSRIFKEGYLKVEGALELLEFLERQLNKEDKTKNISEAI
jgi:hypothetical protein